MHGRDGGAQEGGPRRRAAGELVQRLAQLVRADEAFRVREGRSGFFFSLAVAPAGEEVWVGQVGGDVVLWPASAPVPVAVELAYDEVQGQLVAPQEGMGQRTALSAVAELLTQAFEGRLAPGRTPAPLPGLRVSPHGTRRLLGPG